MANNVLNQFKAYPDAWLTVDRILSVAQNPNTKFLALQILEEAVNVSLSNIIIHYGLDSLVGLASGTENRDPWLYCPICAQGL